MQSLLAARFKLAVHREKRELPLYAMVVSKNGPKFKLTEAVQGPVSAVLSKIKPDLKEFSISRWNGLRIQARRRLQTFPPARRFSLQYRNNSD
jgi:uncharacterized protein (TIGR03435 family)